MSFYSERILPYILNSVMQDKRLAPLRENTVKGAEGRVLEIGIGSGLNLPFYGPNVTEVMALEPSPKLTQMTQELAKKSRFETPLTLLPDSAEAIPFEDASFDTVLTTWTLCSIPDAHRALAEMRRVLKPGGRLLFVEHGKAPDAGVAKWQNRLDPLWGHIAGGCHLNRQMAELITHAGFSMETLNARYIDGPRWASFMYEGSARPG